MGFKILFWAAFCLQFMQVPSHLAQSCLRTSASIPACLLPLDPVVTSAQRPSESRHQFPRDFRLPTDPTQQPQELS